MIVLDVSIVLNWFFPDEDDGLNPVTQDDVNKLGAVVPYLWYYEVANGLLMGLRRNRIVKTDRDRALILLGRLPIQCEDVQPFSTWQDISLLADEHNLTAYDAAYLALAKRRKIPLATLDKALLRAANKEKIQVMSASK